MYRQQYTSEDIPIKEDMWYIVAYHNFYRIHIVPIYFFDKFKAKRALKRVSPGNTHHFEVMPGTALKQYYLNYKLKYESFKQGKATKYDYPKDCITPRQRKSFRDIYVKRLRKLGFVWYHAPIKFHIRKELSIPDITPTKYRHRDNCSVRAFKIGRRKNIIYFLLDYPEILFKDPDNVFKARVLKYNTLKNKFTSFRYELTINKLDTIIPLRINEAKKEILEKGGYGPGVEAKLKKHYYRYMQFKNPNGSA